MIGEWSQWSPCSRSCGSGKRIRSRNVSSGIKCENITSVEQQICGEHPCQCLLDEAFYRRVFLKEPTIDSE